jgi:hypothetical protein
MNVALGDVSAEGMGTPAFDVTHSGGGPRAFVASQSGGNTGGVTLSKFSLNPTGMEQGGGHEGLAGGVRSTSEEISTWPQLSSSAASAEATAAKGEAEPFARWAIAREELIAANTAMPAATKKSAQRILRNRASLNVRFALVITERNDLSKSAEICQHFPW